MYPAVKENVSPSHITHEGLERLDGLVIPPSSPSRSPELPDFSAGGFSPDDPSSSLDGDCIDASSSSEDDDMQDTSNDSESLRPFAGFGSYRQRHGGFPRTATRRILPGCRSGLSREAPAKLGSLVDGSSQADESKMRLSSLSTDSPPPQDVRRSFSTDLDRDEAWERKRDLYLLEDELNDDPEESHMRAVGRSSSDCGNRAWPRPSSKSLAGRSRSLTDEDLEELRGSIDLGFGFRYDESSDLSRTLPALELYYAINRQFLDSKSRCSPVSPLDGTALQRTSSAGSSSSPLNESWRVSSPGDHPSQVKTRLRHWAQVVACSIKQGF